MFKSLKLLYPVYSRRSGGLSLGVDLFPDGKKCNFDCPYCEIFPFPGEPPFEPKELDRELQEFFHFLYPTYLPGSPVRDLCLSGSGEPTISPHLAAALDSIRRACDLFAPEASMVLITNSTTLARTDTADLMGRYVEEAGLRIWAKLDGGNQALYDKMSRSAVPFEAVTAGLLSFSKKYPVIVQTMLCGMDGIPPADADLEDYGALLASLLGRGARFLEIHLCTQARPSPEGRTSPLTDAELLAVAERVSERIESVPVRVFGSHGELFR